MARKYLEDAGVDIDTSIDALLSEQDNRYPQWVEENDTYGGLWQHRLNCVTIRCTRHQ